MPDDRVIDRGAYWEIVYPDGSDTIPKDPNMLDSAAVIAEQKGDKKLAERMRIYAKQIRENGRPSPIEGANMMIVGVVLIAILLIWLLTKKER